MFVKTQERDGNTLFFLCIPEQGGRGAASWKTIEYSVCLGETLNLSSTRWLEILQTSPEFRSVPLEKVLEVVEGYVANHGLGAEILTGLGEAVRGSKQKSRHPERSERRSQEDEYAAALRLLGLPPGSSNRHVESAFRKAARRYHPDVGGDTARFRALVDARNLLLGRDMSSGRTR